jgi:creatinine amidohydrolase
MRKYELALMSYREIEAVDREQAVVLLPVGCVEQHGPCGITGADTLLADRWCRDVASQTADTYVAAPIWYGYTPYTAFAGTITLRVETLKAVVQDVVDGLISHGFKHIVLVNNHGPNEAALDQVAAQVRKEHGITLGLMYPWRLAMHLCPDLYEDYKAVAGHGGEPTISVMMALAPGVVDLTQTGPRGYKREQGPFYAMNYKAAKFEGFDVGLYWGAEEVLPGGASGDWRPATQERGEEILRRMAAYGVKFIPAYREWSQGREAR